MADTKICSKCGRELPISQFYKCKSNKDGLQAHCKECLKQYYAENKEAIAEYKKQYRQENKELIKQWYTKNEERMKQYRKENKETIADYKKQWHTTLKGYCISIRSANIQHDRKHGRIGDELPSNYPTIEDYMELLQMPDFYDGKQYDFTEMGLDRIDNSLPHTLDNIVPCTTQHNRERHLMSFDAFKAKFIAGT